LPRQGSAEGSIGRGRLGCVELLQAGSEVVADRTERLRAQRQSEWRVVLLHGADDRLSRLVRVTRLRAVRGLERLACRGDEAGVVVDRITPAQRPAAEVCAERSWLDD